MPGFDLLLDAGEQGQLFFLCQAALLESCCLSPSQPILLATLERAQHIVQPGVKLDCALPSAVFVKLNEEIFNLWSVKLQ